MPRPDDPAFENRPDYSFDAEKQELTFEVVGVFPFPADMLRRDDARPATERDAALIERLSAEHAPDAESLERPVVIKLVMACEDPWRRGPFTKRWKSFGWDVPGDPHERLMNAAEHGQRQRVRDTRRGEAADDLLDAVQELSLTVIRLAGDQMDKDTARALQRAQAAIAKADGLRVKGGGMEPFEDFVARLERMGSLQGEGTVEQWAELMSRDIERMIRDGASDYEIIRSYHMDRLDRRSIQDWVDERILPIRELLSDPSYRIQAMKRG